MHTDNAPAPEPELREVNEEEIDPDDVEIIEKPPLDEHAMGFPMFYRLAEDPDEAEREFLVPAEYVVCGGCRGKGSRVNRAVDGHGLTAEDFAEDPDFKEAYFSGVYDVTCDTCHGKRVVAEVKVPPEPLPGQAPVKLHPLVKAYLDHDMEIARSEAEDRQTQRMESGYYAGY